MLNFNLNTQSTTQFLKYVMEISKCHQYYYDFSKKNINTFQFGEKKSKMHYKITAKKYNLSS